MHPTVFFRPPAATAGPDHAVAEDVLLANDDEVIAFEAMLNAKNDERRQRLRTRADLWPGRRLVRSPLAPSPPGQRLSPGRTQGNLGGQG